MVSTVHGYFHVVFLFLLHLYLWLKFSVYNYSMIVALKYV